MLFKRLGRDNTSHQAHLVQVGIKLPFAISTDSLLASLFIFLEEVSIALLVEGTVPGRRLSKSTLDLAPGSGLHPECGFSGT